MRPLRAFIALLFLALGVVVGALNPGVTPVDLGLWHIEAALGVLLLAAILCGVLLGGLAMAVAVVLPLRRELRRASLAEESSVVVASPEITPSSSSSAEP